MLLIPFLLFFLIIKFIFNVITNYKNIFNWISLIIIIFSIVLIFTFNIIRIKIDYLLNNYDRNIVIKNVDFKTNKDDYYEELTLENKYKNLSCDGKIKIFINNKKDKLIAFCDYYSVPNGEGYFFYSSSKDELIKKHVKGIESIKKLDTNWYYVNLY